MSRKRKIIVAGGIAGAFVAASAYNYVTNGSLITYAELQKNPVYVLIFFVGLAAVVGFMLPIKPRTKKEISMTEAPVPVQVPISKLGLIPIEITRIATFTGPNGETEQRRVVIAKGRVRATRSLLGGAVTLFKRKTGIPSLPWAMHLVDLRYLTKDKKLRYDENYAEPLDPETGEPARSFELSLMMADALATQGIEVATFLSQFQFSKQTLIIMILAAFIGLLPVIALDPIFHFVPTTMIHWVQYPVK